STLIVPLSPGSTIRTSGWTPRSIFAHAAHTPHASAAGSSFWVLAPAVFVLEASLLVRRSQLSVCATAIAAAHVVEDCPSRIRLGGRLLRAIDRASRSRRRR